MCKYERLDGEMNASGGELDAALMKLEGLRSWEFSPGGSQLAWGPLRWDPAG